MTSRDNLKIEIIKSLYGVEHCRPYVSRPCVDAQYPEANRLLEIEHKYYYTDVRFNKVCDSMFSYFDMIATEIKSEYDFRTPRPICAVLLDGKPKTHIARNGLKAFLVDHDYAKLKSRVFLAIMYYAYMVLHDHDDDDVGLFYKANNEYMQNSNFITIICDLQVHLEPVFYDYVIEAYDTWRPKLGMVLST